MSMSINPGDAAVELTTGSFWEIHQFKRTVTRIDNGPKVCDDLLTFVKDRAYIEEQYSKMLKAWNTKYRKIIEKNASYNTQEASWLQMLNEADRTADLHLKIKENLMTDPYEKVKAWKKENYHTMTLGGLKESKQASDEFSRAQKQWAKYYKKVQDSKKSYFNVCKEERTAQVQENTAKSDASLAPEKLKKLQEVVEKKSHEKAKLLDKYESALVDLDRDQPRYMEDMERAFDRCQEMENKRLDFFKTIFEVVHSHLDLSKVAEYKNIYADMAKSIAKSDADSDLMWWRQNNGPDMPMNWPQFEEYDPERILMQKSMGKKTGGNKVSKHVAGVDSVSSQFTPTYTQSSDNSINTGNGGVDGGRANSWSDDDAKSNPFSADNDVGGNPFGGGGGSEASGDGVLVRALYDYNGQEEDELTFKTGDELYKLEEEDEQGWCKGKLKSGHVGLYPANYVENA